MLNFQPDVLIEMKEFDQAPIDAGRSGEGGEKLEL